MGLADSSTFSEKCSSLSARRRAAPSPPFFDPSYVKHVRIARVGRCMRHPVTVCFPDVISYLDYF